MTAEIFSRKSCINALKLLSVSSVSCRVSIYIALFSVLKVIYFQIIGNKSFSFGKSVKDNQKHFLGFPRRNLTAIKMLCIIYCWQLWQVYLIKLTLNIINAIQVLCFPQSIQHNWDFQACYAKKSIKLMNFDIHMQTNDKLSLPLIYLLLFFMQGGR